MDDVQQLIGEVARRYKIRVEPDDPAFVLVTLNQLVLEETSRELEERVRESIADFAASVQKVEKRAGKVIAQEINERVAEIRCALESDMQL